MTLHQVLVSIRMEVSSLLMESCCVWLMLLTNVLQEKLSKCVHVCFIITLSVSIIKALKQDILRSLHVRENLIIDELGSIDTKQPGMFECLLLASKLFPFRWSRACSEAT